MAAAELKQAGWHITEAALAEYSEGEKNVQRIINYLLDVDLREIGEKSLPEGINKGKIDTISGPLVMQIQKVRNVSAPKENEDSQSAPRLLKLSLSDGLTNCSALEMETVDKISLNTPPGSKIKLKGHITMKHGFLLLNKTNAKFLGGKVAKLVEPWELKRTLAKHTRSNVSEGGPPQFTPFDQRGRRFDPVSGLTNDFKSLEIIKKEPEEKKENDDDFAQQRKATIKEALKGADVKKTFGSGSKPKIQDPDLAKLVDMGFSAEDAGAALKQTGNVSDAVSVLTSGVRQGSGATRGRGRGERGERGERGGHDRGKEEEVVAAPSKPSGPATLFDFLETKIKPEKKAESKYSKPAPVTASVSSSDSSQVEIRVSTNLPPRLQRQQKPQSARQDGRPRHNERGNDNDYSSESSSRDSRETRETRGDYDRNRRRRDFKQDEYNAPRSSYKERKERYDKDSRDENSSRPRANGTQSRSNNGRQVKRSNVSVQHAMNAPQNGQMRNYSEHSSDYYANEEQQFGHYGYQYADPVVAGLQPMPEWNVAQNPDYSGLPSSRRAWRVGEYCTAKYYADNQFYNAIIMREADHRAVYLVNFIEYGNTEECHVNDICPPKTMVFRSKRN